MSKTKHSKFNGAKPNYIYTIISMALILFVLGLLGLTILQGNQVIEGVKSNVILLVEIEEDTNQAGIDSLGSLIKTMNFVQPSSLKYISKEEIAKEMEVELGEGLQVLTIGNPFLNMYNFNPKQSHVQADSLVLIQEKIAQLNHVKGVYYKGNLVEKISENIKKIGYIALGLGVFFIFVALILIHNTIRLALYANRILIKNMQLVGATWGFISKPYIFRSIRHGISSSLIALVGLFLLMNAVRLQLPAMDISTKHASLIALSLLLLGIAISTLSTYFVVRKYLKANIDDLY